VGEDKVIVNETKSVPRLDDIDQFIAVLGEIADYFPEYTGKRIVPIFASLRMGQDVVDYLTRDTIHAMAMEDKTMDLADFRQVGPNLERR